MPLKWLIMGVARLLVKTIPFAFEAPRMFCVFCYQLTSNSTAWNNCMMNHLKEVTKGEFVQFFI